MNRLLCFFALLIFSCSSSKMIQISNTELETNFNNSLTKWTALKKANNNSYEYDVRFMSWVGYSNTTMIVVQNGKVVSRSYLETSLNNNDRYSETEALVFSEKENEINSHEQGYKGVLFDEIYHDCGTKSLQKNEDENNLYFIIDEQGILKNCGSALKNCMDDCSVGVSVSRFRWLE